MRNHKSSRWLGLSLTAILLTITSCKNGNLFGKLYKTGGSNDTRSVLADAQTAYRDRDYNRALELYSDLANREPNNANALYGAASAATASAGLDLATLIASVLKQSSSALSVRGVADIVNQSRVGGGAVTSQHLLDSINTPALKAVLDLAICRLQKIAAGLTNEVAPKKDLDLLVNYAILRLLRALITAQDNNLLTVSNINGSYSVAAGSVITAQCGGATQAQKDALVSVGKDVASAYDILKEAVNNAPPSSNTLLSNLRDDMATVNTQILTANSSLVPQACVDILAAGGITLGNFTSYNEPFTAPTGC
jgi:hypothetical protein